MAAPVLHDRNGIDLDELGAAVQRVRSDPRQASTTVRARSEWQGGFRAVATVRDHEPLHSDEDSGFGGADTAPSPVEQLLAALGNCIAASYAANAAAVGITLEALSVDVEGDLDLHAFLGLALSGGGFERIRATVHVETTAPRELVEELHCGITRTSRVSRSLTNPVPVEVVLA